MKKIALLGTIVLLLLNIFVGCSSDSETTKSMTFVDDLSNIGREFIIYENLRFRVEFFEPYFDKLDANTLRMYEQLEIVPGLVVRGRVTDTTDTWTSPSITGIARNMSSNNNGLTELFELIELAVNIEMTYVINNDEIIAVNVALIGEGVADVAEMLMGGPYMRKE